MKLERTANEGKSSRLGLGRGHGGEVEGGPMIGPITPPSKTLREIERTRDRRRHAAHFPAAERFYQEILLENSTSAWSCRDLSFDISVLV